MTKLLATTIVTTVAGAVALVAHPVAAAPDVPADRVIVHQVPRVPVTIDGLPVSPETMTDYNGRPLYMAALPEGGPHGSLAVFTTPAEFERFVHGRGGPKHALAKPHRIKDSSEVLRGFNDEPHSGPITEQRSNYTYIFEHADFWGYWLGMPSGWGAYDLTEWDMSCQLWFCDEWNDETSAVWADNAFGQTIFEHTGWTGSALWTQGGSWRANLSLIGWNDRASSFGSHSR